MKIAIQVPIKARSSTRVPNKNFRMLCGKCFAYWLLDELAQNLPKDWDIVIDSEDLSKFDDFKSRYGGRVSYHQRDAWYAQDCANGNHLIQQFAVQHPEYSIIAQAYVTAVTLPGAVVRDAVSLLVDNSSQYDSCLLVTEESGWIWKGDEAINYDSRRPDGLPRSQDAMYLKETTGLYASQRDSILRTGCRIGHKPYMFKVEKRLALDVDTMDDLAQAELVLRSREA